MNAETYNAIYERCVEMSYAEIDAALAGLGTLTVRELKTLAPCWQTRKADIVASLIRRCKERRGAIERTAFRD